MKPTLYYMAMMLGVASLILSVVVVTYARSNQELEKKVQDGQAAINRGTMIEQVGTNILKAVAVGSLQDEKLKALLAKNGYAVTVTATPAATPASKSP